MFCSSCGNELPEDAKFCDACGAAVYSTKEENHAPLSNNPEGQSGRNVTKNIILGSDGKYHWYYEFKLLKNPTILKLLWKIFFWIFIGIWGFVCIMNTSESYFDFMYFIEFTLYFMLILVGVEAFVSIGYFIYAVIQGFKYCVMFEMDEDGVTHTQMQKQFKKSQAISLITIFMGTASNQPGAIGTGLLSASRSSMSSSWREVRNVEIIRKHDVIKVNGRLNKNQVYALPDDFPFVEDFIRKHVSKRCSIKVNKL